MAGQVLRGMVKAMNPGKTTPLDERIFQQITGQPSKTISFAEFMRLGFMIPMMLHGLLAATFGVAYELNKHKLPEMARTDGVWFMAMAFVFPVLYLTMTPLGLATLATTSWETRGAAKKKNSSKTAVAK